MIAAPRLVVARVGHAVDPQDRHREHDRLEAIRGVREDLLVARVRRVEHDLGDHLTVRAERPTVEHTAVGEDEAGGALLCHGLPWVLPGHVRPGPFGRSC
jgi:hypothetical protein